MADQISTLTLGVDSTPVQRAEDQLDRMAAAGVRAERSAEQLATSFRSVSGAVGEQARVQAQAQATQAQLLASAAAGVRQTQQAAAGAAEAFGAFGRATAGAANGARLVGVSAAQATAAMRQLPAQFTDIATQLAGGQSPFLVLLQQGGQIKDSFGGVGNAARALASTLTPLRLAFGGVAAVAAAGALAYKQGSEEIDRYRRALVLTGNAAGTTVGELQQMAAAVAGVTGATQGRSAEVLTQLAASAKVARGELVALTEAAIRMERAGGPAAEETAKAFADLARNPSQAAERLNESTKFLTASLYEQIRALERQGKTAEAAAVAQAGFAQVTKDRAAELERGLGSLEKGWRSVTDAAKGAWDAMLAIGRPETVQSQLEAASEAVRRARENLAGGSGPLGVGIEFGGQQGGTIAASADLDKALDAQGIAQSDERVQRLAASLQKAGVAANDARIELSKIGESFKTPDEKLKESVAKLRELAATGKVSAAELAAVERLVRSNSEATAQAVAISQARIAGQADRAAIAINAQINTLQTQRQLGLISEIELIERVTRERVKLLAVERQRLEQERRAAASLPNSGPRVAGIDQQIQTVDARRLVEEAEGRDAVTAAVQRQRLETERLYEAEREQNRADIAAFQQRENEQIKAGTQAVIDYARSIDETNERTALEASLIGASSKAREIALAQFDAEIRLRRQLEAIKTNPGFDQAKRNEESAKAIEANARERASIETRISLDEWKKTNEQIAQSLTDALFEGGRSFRDYLVGLFRTTVLRPVIQAVFAPFAAGLSTAAQAASGGVASITGAAGGGQFGQAASLFNAGKSIYEGFASSFTGVGLQAANLYGTTIANAAGTGLDGFLATNNAFGTAGGAGGTGTAIGGVASAAAGAAVGIAGGRAISGGYAAFGGSGNGTVNAGTAIGAAVGSIVPVIGTAVGAAVGGLVGGLVNRLFGRRAPEIEGRSITGSFTGSDFTGQRVTDIVERGGLFRSDRRSQQSEAITGDLDKALDAGAKQLSDLAAKYGQALGLPVDELANVTSQISVKITDDAAENTKAIEAALQQYADALLGAFADDVEPLRNAGETVAQVIERVGGNLLQVNATLQQLGITALATSIDGGRAAVALADLFGGASTLAQAGAGFYQKFYSEAERADRATEQITETLADLGLALPKTRDEFRALVEAQDLTTTSGREAFAALLGVSDAFDALQTAAGDSATALADILEERRGLETQLLELQGNTVELRRRERDALDESNRALFDQIKALEDQAEATKKATEAAERAAEEAARAAERQAQREAAVTRGADAIIGDFLSGDALIRNRATRINEILTEGGITGGTIEGIIGSTREDIVRLWNSVGTAGREAILDALSLWEDLDEMVNGTARAVSAFRSGSLADQIEQARLSSLSPQARIARLRSTEETLFGQLATAEDPVAVAERLTGVITDRISEEARLQAELGDTNLGSLREQLEAAKSIRDVAASLPQFTAQLRFGDLSPLSARDQVGEARKLFESTLLRAQGGDKAAAGLLQTNAQAFLQEAAAAFGSDQRFAAVFEQVTGSLDAFAAQFGTQLDPQIAALEAQLTAAETTAENSGEMLAALLRIDAALSGRAAPAAAGSTTATTTGTTTGTAAGGATAGAGTASGTTTNTAGAGTAAVPVSMPPVVDFGQRTDALFRSMLDRLTSVQTNTGRLEQLVALQGSELNATREGFTQLNARAVALEAVQTRMLAQITNGRAPT